MYTPVDRAICVACGPSIKAVTAFARNNFAMSAYHGGMTTAWRERLRTGEVLVIDGGTGTELRRRGFPMHVDLWSGLAAATHYELLRDVHADFIAAGADVITTNTFATARFVLDAAGHGDDFETINRRAVGAAIEARERSGRDVTIAGSVSCLPPAFDRAAYPRADAERRAYRELALLLADAGVDLIALEMMQETEHAALACEAIRSTGLPFWLGVSCRARDGALVAFDDPNVSLDDYLGALLAYGPEAVNVMHSPPAAVEPALRRIRERWPGVLGAYPALPGAGAIEHELGEPVSPRELAALAARWIASGACIVGGCCGTTPAHIAAIRAAVGSG
jgi:homocysteine S-methyltransferase